MPGEVTDDTAGRLFARRPYVLFLAARFCGTLGTTAQNAVLAWEVYARVSRTGTVAEASFAVGMVGLVQFLPLVALTLVAGETADRHDRRRILAGCFAAELLIAVGLAGQAWFAARLWPLFTLAATFGCVRAFFQPTASALGPMLVPPALLPRAIATNSQAFQLSAILGPALGGLLCVASPAVGYLACAGLYGVSTTLCLLVRADTRPVVEPGRSRAAQIREGLAYIRHSPLVFGAISLDLFAVLLGGATALLPVFAESVLCVGSRGYGVLRAAPAVGGLVVAAVLAVRPIRTGAGPKMLFAVAAFGLMTVVFAGSRSFPLSVAALALLGGADMVSVFIRQSLVQIATPDRMRGRVSAVSTLFIGASNELGEFESGVVARFVGPVAAVALGGAGSLAVTAAWAWLFPALRRADRLG